MEPYNRPVLTKMAKYKIKTSNKCVICYLNGTGIYRFLCEHTFICINCINEKTIKKIETGTFLEYCKKCKEPINPTFADHMANSDYYNVSKKAFDWKKDNIK